MLLSSRSLGEQENAGEHEPQANVATAFLRSPKLPQVFLKLNRNTEKMFCISLRKCWENKTGNHLLILIFKMLTVFAPALCFGFTWAFAQLSELWGDGVIMNKSLGTRHWVWIPSIHPWLVRNDREWCGTWTWKPACTLFGTSHKEVTVTCYDI